MKTFKIGSLIAYKALDGSVRLGTVTNNNLPAQDGNDINMVSDLTTLKKVEVITDNCKLICEASEVS